MGRKEKNDTLITYKKYLRQNKIEDTINIFIATQKEETKHFLLQDHS